MVSDIFRKHVELTVKDFDRLFLQDSANRNIDVYN